MAGFADGGAGLSGGEDSSAQVSLVMVMLVFEVVFANAVGGDGVCDFRQVIICPRRVVDDCSRGIDGCGVGVGVLSGGHSAARRGGESGG